MFFLIGVSWLNIKINPKGKPMKRSLIVLSAFTFLMACNNGPKTPATTYSLSDSLKFVKDTTGLAAYQAWKAEHELGVNKDQPNEKVNAAAVSSAKESSHRPTTRSSGNSGSGTSSSGTASSGTGSSGSTGTAAPAKKGWSKTAKGAVIGGVVGAGAGAVIGHDMDKKDGRH